MNKDTINYLLFIFCILAALMIGYGAGKSVSESYYKPQINGLHKQIIRQTNRIAELTGNGG
ncbi:TPA: hypothetical protein U3L57_000092 [Streptococcus agalactiae]|nr:hypothetical protein [Streptococcus agalactiae]